jgi:pimeloyl-ACP methyl ester carboxylesterase
VQTNSASSYINLPVWAFVGSADVIVDPISSTTIVPMINNLGGNAQIKVYDGATHFDVPDLTYKDTSVNVLNWMISKTK